MDCYARRLLSPVSLHLCAGGLRSGFFPTIITVRRILRFLSFLHHKSAELTPITSFQFDLDLSVEKGLWATQRHNEGILDQAFRTSKEVYLIFGVNKSGEFYGYAK